MPQYGQIDKYAIPKGYVNATQMAKANQKLLSDYIRRYLYSSLNKVLGFSLQFVQLLLTKAVQNLLKITSTVHTQSHLYLGQTYEDRVAAL